jgi:hypothetical protein
MTAGAAKQIYVKHTYNGVAVDSTTITISVTCSTQTFTPVLAASYQLTVPMVTATIFSPVLASVANTVSCPRTLSIKDSPAGTAYSGTWLIIE